MMGAFRRPFFCSYQVQRLTNTMMSFGSSRVMWRQTFAITLPLLLSLVWPRSHGPSLMVTPFLMGMGVVAIAGLGNACKGRVGAAIWLLVVLGVIASGPATEAVMVASAVGAAIVTYVCLSLGHECHKNENLLRAMTVALALGMVINSAVAWLQFFDVEEYLYPLVSQNDSPRPYGNLRQANHLASMCVLGLASSWWLLQKQIISRPVTMCMAFMAYSALAMTGSRIGLIEVFAMALLIMIWQRKCKKINAAIFGLGPVWLILMIVTLPAISQLVGENLETLSQRDGSSITARVELWKAAWKIAINHPVQGVGWGEFRYASFVELPVIVGVENASNAHNLPLHLIAELGFAGAFIVLIPVIWVLLKRRLWWKPEDSVCWALLVLVATGLHSLVEFPLWYLNFLIPTSVAFGVILSKNSHGAEVRVECSSRLGVQVCCVILITAASVFSYDYFRVARAFNEGDRASGNTHSLVNAQKTWLFRSYADQALVDSIPVTQANSLQMLALTDRLMHEGPNPLVFWTRLAAMCVAGGGLQARELAEDFQQRFPDAHAEFKTLSPGDSYLECMK